MVSRVLAPGLMSRNFYVLAASLVLFSLVSCGLMLTTRHYQPGLAGNASLWKTISLFLFVGGLLFALLGVFTALFEQVERRNEERRRQRQKGR